VVALVLTSWLHAADVIADVALVASSLQLWRDTGLSRNRKILISSAFGASLLITAVTIPHNIMLIKFKSESQITFIFAHVKVSTLPTLHPYSPPIKIRQPSVSSFATSL
jgi:hypothetical protein